MALQKVSDKYIRQNENDYHVQFFFDSFGRASLHIWMDQKTGEWEKFELSFRESFLEWRKKQGFRFGTIDEGEELMGIKKSPVVHLTQEFKKGFLEKVVAYLKLQNHSPEIDQVLFLLEEWQNHYAGN